MSQSVTILSKSGQDGGTAAATQAADQGEDQGENLDQYGSGFSRTGPTLVRATNSIASGDANGGNGGNVTATINNFVKTHCNRRGATALVFAVPVIIRSGDGGNGGTTGAGQGTDQGEDQGENIAQRSGANTDVSPTAVRAINAIVSGRARGGRGGNIDVTFNQHTLCVEGPFQPTPPPPPAGVQRDAVGNVSATFVTHTDCTSAAPATVVIQSGSGGRGGVTGSHQGTDQGEDQGENIAQFARGNSRGGATTVSGSNSLNSLDSNGGVGRDIAVTFDNYIDASCGLRPSASVPLVVQSGAGGRGGYSGNGQGLDQGEDQGENIGQFAAANSVVGPVTVWAQNTIVSSAVTGGGGGNITITYNDFGNCEAGAAVSSAADERVSVEAGAGGQGGTTGRHQGSDQGEDQGENIGQFASGYAFIGSSSVTASNSNRSGDAGGGAGGRVKVTFHAGNCSAALTESEGVTGSAGTGGPGGETGAAQGSDQGEDQGENIASGGAARFGHTTVRARNRNIAGDAMGGNGGDVVVEGRACNAGNDSRVSAMPGAGGAGGSSGAAQGSDQGEDQGENIGLNARGNAGSASVSSDSHNTSGHAGSGRLGKFQAAGCVSQLSGMSRAIQIGALTQTPVDPDVTICRGAFYGNALDIEVPRGAVCRVSGATVRHNIDVEAGGVLIASGTTVGHDVTAYRASGLRVLGGRVAHSVVSMQLLGAPAGSANAICGVRIEHDVRIGDSRANAGSVLIGGTGCAGNRVGHDLQVFGNSSVSVVNNQVDHDAVCPLNRRFSGHGNHAMHVNTCG